MKVIRLLLAWIFGGLVGIGCTTASAQVLPSCTATMTNMVFSGSVIRSQNLDTTATLTINCTGTGQATVCPSIGTGVGGVSGSDRLLTALAGSAGAGTSLRFQLYQDAARTVMWGHYSPSIAGEAPAITITRGTPRQVTVYGRIFGAQPAWPGSYESSFQGIHTQLTAYTQAVPTCAGEVSPSVAFGFTASLNVVKDCAVTAQDLSFGTVGVLRTVKDAASQLSVTCTQGTAYTIGLQPQGGSLPVGQWRMVKGTDFILYGLYRDAARTRGWDMATANLASGTGTGVAQSIPVYGRLPVQKAPVVGGYTDTVVVTVTY